MPESKLTKSADIIPHISDWDSNDRASVRNQLNESLQSGKLNAIQIGQASQVMQALSQLDERDKLRGSTTGDDAHRGNPISRITGSIYESFGLPANPGEWAGDAYQGAKEFISSPLGTAKLVLGGMGDAVKGQYQKASEQLKSPDWRTKLRAPITAIPIFGGNLNRAGDQAIEGDYSGALGTMIGTAAQILPLAEHVSPGSVANTRLGRATNGSIAQGAKETLQSIFEKNVTNPQAANLTVGKRAVSSYARLPEKADAFGLEPAEEALRAIKGGAVRGETRPEVIKSFNKYQNSVGGYISELVNKADKTPDIPIDGIKRIISDYKQLANEGEGQATIKWITDNLKAEEHVSPAELWSLNKRIGKKINTFSEEAGDASSKGLLEHVYSYTRGQLEKRVPEVAGPSKTYAGIDKYVGALEKRASAIERSDLPEGPLKELELHPYRAGILRSLYKVGHPRQWTEVGRILEESKADTRGLFDLVGKIGKLPTRPEIPTQPWQRTLVPVDKFGLKPFGSEENPSGIGPLFEGTNPSGVGGWKTPAEQFEALPDVIKKFLKLGI